MPKRVNNYEKVSDGFYLCRDAKGFQDSVCNFWGYTRQPVVHGTPNDFPCLVSLAYLHQGNPAIIANSVPLTDLGTALKQF